MEDNITSDLASEFPEEVKQENNSEKLDELSNKVTKLKKKIAFFKPIVKDFQNLLMDKPLFERSSYIYLNRLAKLIKTEMMREMTSKLLGPIETVEGLTKEIEEYKSAIEVTNFDLKQSVLSTNERCLKLVQEKNDINDEISKIHEYIEDIKGDLSAKATFSDFVQLSERVKHKTELVDFLALKAYVPTVQQVDLLNAQMEQLTVQMRDYVSLDLLGRSLKDTHDEFYGEMNKYMKVKSFEDSLTMLEEGILKNSKRCSSLQSNFENRIGKIYNRLEHCEGLFSTKVWMPDLEPLEKSIAKKTPLDDFVYHKNHSDSKIKEFSSKIDLFSNKISDFSVILERYDEILLDKSSKDDFSKLQNYVRTLVRSEDFEHLRELTERKVQEYEVRILQQKQEIKENNEQVQYFEIMYSQFKADAKRLKKYFDGLGSLKELVESKADQSFVLTLRDLFSRKDEFSNLKSKHDLLNKQFSQFLILVLETVKTMVKSSDSQSARERTRLEICRNLSSLYDWVSSSEISTLELSKQRQSSCVNVNEKNLPMLTPRKSKNFSVSPSSRTFKYY